MKRKRADLDRENTLRATRPTGSRRETSSSNARQDPVASIHRTVGNQAVQAAVENELGDRINESAHNESEGAIERSAPESGAGGGRSERSRSPEPTADMCPRCARLYRAGKPLDCEECERTLGNEGTAPTLLQSMDKGAIQPKLTVGEPNDRYEREADRVADWVLRTTEPAVDADAEIHRKGSGGDASAVDGRSERRIRSLRGSGRSLSESERSFFEPRFGADFSDVRVHTGVRAAKLTDAINARAFTYGQDIYFARGAYKPEVSSGKRLLAHELTHVVQQDAATDYIQREVASDYSQIQEKLSYELLLDWVITDEEARDVLTILESLSDQDLIDTYYQMVVDGLWGRLESNVPSDAQDRFDQLAGQIRTLTTVTELTPSDRELITDICTFFFPGNPPDCVNQEVANIALQMVVEAKERCSKLMDLVPRPPPKPSLFWLLKQVGKPIWRRIRREGRIYEACRATVSRNFRSAYEIAQIECHT